MHMPDTGCMPVSIAAPQGGVASPCISVCTMDASTQLCLGCFRTLSEIAQWASMDDQAKRETWVAIQQRAAVSIP